MQKAQNNVRPLLVSWQHIFISFAFVLVVPLLSAQSGKSTISYPSEDSLELTADEFITNDSLPYLILIHEQESSRGEYIEIIHRFQKMNFNCLVPDIRNGGNSNFIGNETAKRCRVQDFSKGSDAVEGDIIASINYAVSKSGKKVILIGAGANGSLALKTANEQENVRAVIALSPGEFFRPSLNIEETIMGLEKPILITSSQMEFPYAKQLVNNVAEEYKTVFAPETSEGSRGTTALLSGNTSEGEYWLAILLFFKDLQ